MGDILYICAFICLAFSFVHGDQCKNEAEKYYVPTKYPIYEIESQQECQRYLETNVDKGDFVFYVKSPSEEQICELSTSLYKMYSNNNRTHLGHLFNITLTLNDVNKAPTVKIRRSQPGNKDKIPDTTTYTYSLEADNNQRDNISLNISNSLESGNEIHISLTCTQQTTTTLLTTGPAEAPLHPTKTPSSPQQTTKALQTTVPAKAPLPSARTPSPPQQSLNSQSTTTTPNAATISHIHVIAIVILVLALVVIIVANILVIRRNKKRDRDLEVIELTDQQPRQSRHVSENTQCEGYDNHGMIDTNTRTTANATNSETTSATISVTSSVTTSTTSSVTNSATTSATICATNSVTTIATASVTTIATTSVNNSATTSAPNNTTQKRGSAHGPTLSSGLMIRLELKGQEV